MSAKPQDAVARDDLRTPLARARGLGPARHGVGHWWTQRLTAIALIPLALWFAWLVLRLPRLDFAGAHDLVANPINALLLIVFTATMFWHGQLGLQVVIEDYVHTRWIEITLLVAVKFLAVLGALACLLAVLAVWLGVPGVAGNP